ncbi:hypothetical protein TNCV_471681 [Trichonephila clavipes]|nr:hypothetical protein TNCV_471681 [Trichonephila clavipes]
MVKSDVDDTWSWHPSPNYHTTPTEDISALDRFGVHRCPTRQGLWWYWARNSGDGKASHDPRAYTTRLPRPPP